MTTQRASTVRREENLRAARARETGLADYRAQKNVSDAIDRRADLDGLRVRRNMTQVLREASGPTARELYAEQYEQAWSHYIRSDEWSPILERRDLGEASTGIGGALVPVGFENQLLNDLRAATPILGHTQIVDTSQAKSPGSPLNYPALVSASLQSGQTAEDTLVAEGDLATLGQIAWPSAVTYSAAQLARVSYALVNDSAFPLEDLLRAEFARRTARGVEADIVAALQASVTNKVALSATAPYFTFANILQIYSSIDAAYRVGAIWVLSPTASVQLRSVVDSSLRPLIGLDASYRTDTDNQGMQQSALMLMGCPVFEASGVGWAAIAASGSGIVGAFLNPGKTIPVRYAGSDIIPLPTRFADYGEFAWNGFARFNASNTALLSAACLITNHS